MRHHETELDRQKEAKVGEVIEAHFRCKLFPAPRNYKIDFLAVRNKRLVAFVEVKNRNYTMAEIERMGGYLVALQKWTHAKAVHDVTGLKFVLAIGAQDGVWVAAISDFFVENLVYGGRTDRGDWQDMEPCVLVPVSRFKKIT